MPVDRTLAQVELDLLDGRVVLARQRLRGLVGSMPFRLDLRVRLADVYRREGDLAQAGRWSYLDGSRLDDEVAAFMRAYGGDPIRLMRALSWPGVADDAVTDLARDRLHALRARAQSQYGAALDYRDPRHPEPAGSRFELLGAVGCGIVVVTVLILALVGLISLSAHGLDVLLDVLDD